MTNEELDDLLRREAQSYNRPVDIPREAMWERIEAARASASVVPLGGAHRLRWARTAAGIAAVLVIGIGIGRLTRGGAGVTAGSRVATIGGSGNPAGTRASSPAESHADSARDAGSPTEANDDESLPSARGTRGPSGPRGVAAVFGPDRNGRGRGADGGNAALVATAQENDDRGAYRLAVVEHMARTELLLTSFRAQSQGASSDSRADAQFANLSRELLQTTRLLLATRTRDDPTLTRLLQDLELVLMQITQYTSEGRRGDLESINQSLDRSNVIPKLRSTIPAGAPVPAGT